MDDLDRRIINNLQDGFPLGDRPYQEVAAGLGTSEERLIERVRSMLADGRLSRFGPLYNVEMMGGSFSLCAMSVPVERFAEVAEQVNSLPQVAHNYERDHQFNMWFVLATESMDGIAEVVAELEKSTGLPVYEFPKLDEYYVGLRFNV
jgi:DNA-binding Lrp family transcriptional regulator